MQSHEEVLESQLLSLDEEDESPSDERLPEKNNEWF